MDAFQQGSWAQAIKNHLADRIFLEEANRPKELLSLRMNTARIFMNSKDLRAAEHVQRLVEIRCRLLKIEGRTKSHYYAARTAQGINKRLMMFNGRPFATPNCWAYWRI